MPSFRCRTCRCGVFSPPGRTVPDAKARGGMAIGDMIFDLRAAHDAGLFSGVGRDSGGSGFGRQRSTR